MANYYGRVEIEYDGVRGTVCDYEWSTYDARVLCRQLGFPDGEAYKKAYYGRGNGSVVLSGKRVLDQLYEIIIQLCKSWMFLFKFCVDQMA